MISRFLCLYIKDNGNVDTRTQHDRTEGTPLGDLCQPAMTPPEDTMPTFLFFFFKQEHKHLIIYILQSFLEYTYIQIFTSNVPFSFGSVNR